MESKGFEEFIKPEDIEVGKTELTSEQMEQLKRRMAVDFAPSTQRLTPEEWNERHYKAKDIINNCTPREFIESREIKRQTKIYLKGRYVKKLETGEWVDV